MKNSDELTVLRDDLAKASNTMSDLRDVLNKFERDHPCTSECVASRLAGQSVRRINALYLEAYREMLVLDGCFED